ncbi:anhydro-N-acetylmuramic acid kinase [Malikia sp.]|uniref:anhydro-N-acetylmuramic acid kinase n=1 Tax=Malikia sp. TaxID=2070706 RepID=UPI00263237A3|nr:anhydro-N-acetylmuramic acid kinase [Malikia sp.]MDD2730178.1 anhydro-N-acetylmuramic acid kinase [Malikia sp.]
MPDPTAGQALYIGLMSGTSLDGADGVLVDFAAQPPRVLVSHGLPLPENLRAELLALNASGPDELHRAAVAAHQLTRVYAEVVQALLADSGTDPRAVRAIGAHGQTVRHHPPGARLRGQRVDARNPAFPPYTLQLNAPALLAELSGIAVVADFRSRDIAAGGQGAPLVPAFHREVFGQAEASVAVVNIGGIANVTALMGDGRVLGLDTGPGNMLLDLWCLRHTGAPYDRGGAWGASGRADDALLARLLAEPYFALPGIKSTGRDLFHAGWLEQQLQGFAPLAPADVQATLVELTARSIAQTLRRLDWGKQALSELLVCGGGARNDALMAALRRELPACPVQTTAERGWPVDLVEAAAFAWLAWQTLQGQPGNLGAVTGAAGSRILGAIYPA